MSELKKHNKATVADVAALAGVSPATVSRVLNHRGIVSEETSSRVLQAANSLNYTLPNVTSPLSASSPAPARMDTNSGLILVNIPSLSNSFYDEVIKGARTSVRQHGYNMLINESQINNESIDFIISLLEQYNVMGLITMSHLETSLGNRLAAVVPMVQCSEYNKAVETPYVSIDNEFAAQTAINHLLSLGRRRIGFLNGPISYQYARSRLSGYRAALRAAHIPYNENYVVSVPDINGDFALSAAMQLLTLPEPPDAVFCASDEFAAPLLRACHQLGLRVPDDIAAVGIDNLDMVKYLIPSFSSVSQPKTQIGFLAAEALFEKLAMPDAPNRKTLLSTELIIRESSSITHSIVRTE